VVKQVEHLLTEFMMRTQKKAVLDPIKILGLVLIVLAGSYRPGIAVAGAPVQKDPGTSGLRIATFDMDVTPPVGSIMAYNPVANTWDLGLRAKGMVLLGSGKPIVICSVDWIGIANESQDSFKTALALAAGTIPERVAIHTIHQHDAPVCDFGAEKLLLDEGLDPNCYEGSFAREVIRRLKTAVQNSISHAQSITEVGFGEAEVYGVASNRRILGEDGHVKAMRFTTCEDSLIRAEPEGLVDPMVSLVSFWNHDRPVAVLSYYATHPQSYYQTGIANPDFPGIARFIRQLAVPDALHIHFNGAGGNIGAGKYNDGSHVNRGILAERLADGMKRAWDRTTRMRINAGDITWMIQKVALPPAQNFKAMEGHLNSYDTASLTANVSKLAWLKRCEAGKLLDLTSLGISNVRILHMPGELFVEYQLAAKAMRPDMHVAMAAYGDYGPEYICTAIAYEQGGYEAGTASGVTREAEDLLMSAIQKLLQGNP